MSTFDIQSMTRNYNWFRFGEDNFHELTRHRIRRILLVSTFYDAFILEQDGHLAEQIRVDYRQLNLTETPRISTAPTGEMALRMLKERSFDLVITLMRIGEMSPFELARSIKDLEPKLPVILLLNVGSDLALIERQPTEMKHIDKVFLWRGDSRLFLAMLKSQEDKINAPHDTVRGLVRVILLVEDSVADYSRFLPMLYTEVMKQTHLNMSEERNSASRTLRMRARPKVLLAHNYEEAWQIYQEYADYLLCVISDVSFNRAGVRDEKAGIRLIEAIRAQKKTLPACLHSAECRFLEAAQQLEASFLHKTDAAAMRGLKLFIENNLGFGDFIFRDKEGKEIGRASTMGEFEERLREVPVETLLYHGRRDHFSTWLVARGELEAARRLRPVVPEDFDSGEGNRRFLVQFLEEVRIKKDRGRIVDFAKKHFHHDTAVLRLGAGSFGGKGRGLAFLNAFLSSMGLEDHFEGAKVKIPKTAIIGTEEFDIFLERNKLAQLAELQNDEEVKRRILEGSFSPSLEERLREFCEVVTTPLAVRSSSLLEDSQSQPFAGIYQTYMLPNTSPDPELRYQQLSMAIKLVYASGFLSHAQEYFDIVEYGMEEEKMAVVVQEVVGTRRGELFYPHFSGVACSYDYYPMPFMKSSDGIARLAVGLGKYVVEGRDGYRFCPRYPSRSTLASDEIARGNQTEFYAIDLSGQHVELLSGEDATLRRLPIKTAETQGVLWQLASTYDPHAKRIVEGISGPGTRVIDFSGILKAESFPLAQILQTLLDVGEKAMGVPVEIEFAVSLDKERPRPGQQASKQPTFYVLQIRPLLGHKEGISIRDEEFDGDDVFLIASGAMGNDDHRQLQDIVYVKPEAFDKVRTAEMVAPIAAINEQMRQEGRRYLLMGPGRWGTRDRFLGIPVCWGDISRAAVIVEAGLDKHSVEASQGTHFFHNLLALNVGYLSVAFDGERDTIDYDWLASLDALSDGPYVRHVRAPAPLHVRIDGRRGLAVIRR